MASVDKQQETLTSLELTLVDTLIPQDATNDTKDSEAIHKSNEEEEEEEKTQSSTNNHILQQNEEKTNPSKNTEKNSSNTSSPRQAAYDYLIKLLMIGDSGVGKSCVLLRFSDDSFTTSFITTIGIDFKLKTLNIMGFRVKLQIWDTAGQQRFRTITTAYYRGAMGIILLYDITDEQSFLNIRNWIRNIEQHASDSVIKILAGNKSDLDSQRIIDKNRGQELADEYGIKFYECSAKTGINVDRVFNSLALDIVMKKLKGGLTEPEHMTIYPNPPKIQALTQWEFRRFEMNEFVLEMFDIKKMVYSYQGLKSGRRILLVRFILALLMLTFYPITLIFQYSFFMVQNYGSCECCENIMNLYSPTGDNVYYVQRRVFFDLLDVIMRTNQKVSANSFEKQTRIEMVVRTILCLVSIAIYISIWFSFNWYQIEDEYTNLSAAECIGPLGIFAFLIFSVSLWLSYESKIMFRSIDLASIAFHPLCFVSKYDQEINKLMDSSETEQTMKTNVSIFLESISTAQDEEKKKYTITILAMLFSIIYGLSSSFSRVLQNEPFMSDNIGIWILCLINNITLSYIVVRLCVVTTTAAFGDVLMNTKAVTQILSPYKQRFMKTNKSLPFLNLNHSMNLSSWMQLRGYIYIRSMSRMINVEIWMAIFIIVEIILCGVCLYRIVEIDGINLSNILSDDVLLSCMLFVILGFIYVNVVVGIGSLFQSLQRKQIRCLLAQSASIDYQLIKNGFVATWNQQQKQKRSSINFQNENNEDIYRKELIHVAIERTVLYLREHDITPLIFGVRLDKVLWKSLFGLVLSIVASAVASYTRSK